jgi:hypothetical protein
MGPAAYETGGLSTPLQCSVNPDYNTQVWLILQGNSNSNDSLISKVSGLLNRQANSISVSSVWILLTATPSRTAKGLPQPILGTKEADCKADDSSSSTEEL